jgi:predicted  nucleic acid-binding Zn-ribbon protein
MTTDIVNTRMESAQTELQARIAELQSMETRATELAQQIHNLKVQIATYQDLLTDNTEDISSEVRETVESLVAGE